MPKDSQIDPKPLRKMKSKGGPTMYDEKPDNEGRNAKKQSIISAPEGGIPKSDRSPHA